MLLTTSAIPAASQTDPHPNASPLRLDTLAPGVYVVPGDTGRGSEGRANAGFITTGTGVVAIDALGHPRDGARLVASIRSVTTTPVQWLVLTHHHPDHQFGAVSLRRVGAKVVAHPDMRFLAIEAGADALVADWVRLSGVDAMRGFEYANRPDRPVVGSERLSIGRVQIDVVHPGPAHSPGDLYVWLPASGVLFAGDLVVEDGVTMVVDGDSRTLLRALDALEALRPKVIVPGHGRVSRDPARLIDSTRRYITRLQSEMRDAVVAGVPLQRALRGLAPPDEDRPVSLNSRLRRNALRVYLEEERSVMGLDSAESR